VHPVPIQAICASEGRSHDFDRWFNPIRKHNKQRWMDIASACVTGRSLPAVDLIQVGDRYIVRDGHHRISVAKALGAEHIDASITVWEV
jgi:ParB-like chromosome segregation protein Spo0J